MLANYQIANKYNVIENSVSLNSIAVNPGGANTLYNSSGTGHYTHNTNDLEPLTTKGDIQVFSSTNDRLPIGTNGKLLRANSATATGLDYIGDIDPTTGNCILGQGAGAVNVAIDITAFGTGSLAANTSGTGNTSVGFNALNAITTNTQCTAVGFQALKVNTATGSTGIGSNSLAANTTGQNTAIGANSLSLISTGTGCVAVGLNALQNTTGSANTAVGAASLLGLLTGTDNIAIGLFSGFSYGGAETNNICIGANVTGTLGESNAIRIGLPGTATTCTVGGISGVTSAGAVPVVINAAGLLGTVVSSERYKKNIEDMKISEKIYLLRPVEFDYKSNDEHSYGLIAEEVNQIIPEIVIKNAEGECETIQYQHLVPMLLNELIKQDDHIMQLEEKIISLSKMAEKIISLAELVIPSNAI